MKLLSLLSLLISFNIFAFPAVGDFARYEAQFRGEKVVMEKELLDFSSERKAYKQLTRLLVKGEVVQEQLLEIESLWFYTEVKVNNVLTNCLRREGALGQEEIEGNLVKVCTFYNEDAQLDYSIGMVPFGQVRFQLFVKGEEFLDFNLVKFRSNSL